MDTLLFILPSYIQLTGS